SRRRREVRARQKSLPGRAGARPGSRRHRHSLLACARLRPRTALLIAGMAIIVAHDSPRFVTACSAGANAPLGPNAAGERATMRYVVELAISEADFTDQMNSMRAWLDHRRCQPSAFRFADPGRGCLVPFDADCVVVGFVCDM